MAKIQELFDYMKSEIEHASNEEIMNINNQIEKLEKEIDADAYHQAQKDFEIFQKENAKALNKDLAKKVSDDHIEKNKQLATLRESYVDTLFDTVKDQLLEFTATKSYKEYIEKKLKTYATDINAECTVFIRKEDASLKPLIQKYFKDASVKENESMHLGGLQITDATKFIDDSFENQLLTQRKWFTSHSNLTIVKGDD